MGELSQQLPLAQAWTAYRIEARSCVRLNSAFTPHAHVGRDKLRHQNIFLFYCSSTVQLCCPFMVRQAHHERNINVSMVIKPFVLSFGPRACRMVEQSKGKLDFCAGLFTCGAVQRDSLFMLSSLSAATATAERFFPASCAAGSPAGTCSPLQGRSPPPQAAFKCLTARTGAYSVIVNGLMRLQQTP